MERFFKLLYYYCLGLLVFITVYMVVMLAVAPKTDALKRGFIPCTETFVNKVSGCERGGLGCIAGGIWQDTKCNLYVIFDGAGAWIRGKQPTPWANYLFVPKAEAEIDADNQYMGVVSEDVWILESQRSFLEAKQQELENAKQRNLHLDKNVLSAEDAEQDRKYEIEEKTEPVRQSGDFNIEDEAFSENFSEQAEQTENNEKNITPVSATEKAKALLKQNARKSKEKKGETDDK